MLVVFFFKQKTAYEMRISDWSSDVCSSDLGQNRSSVVRSMPRSIGKAQCLVIIEAVRGRSRVRRQGQFRQRLEIGDRGVAPPPGLMVLDRKERRGDRKSTRLNSSH